MNNIIYWRVYIFNIVHCLNCNYVYHPSGKGCLHNNVTVYVPILRYDQNNII